ncbi:hypothetical protein HZH66_010131 [Vespula vulgaris]|uniref:Uncharacterized protein n=1 Tax=Vespula vulgaris TaxID=7454 RepID=A0A834JL80_VESVU|nr:hypothetical protein HZH66_010131 [Vespula vulgaris]
MVPRGNLKWYRESNSWHRRWEHNGTVSVCQTLSNFDRAEIGGPNGSCLSNGSPNRWVGEESTGLLEVQENSPGTNSPGEIDPFDSSPYRIMRNDVLRFVTKTHAVIAIEIIYLLVPPMNLRRLRRSHGSHDGFKFIRRILAT